MGRLPAVILAGGLSRRMGGGDKGLRPFGSGTLLHAVLARVASQAGPVALNANGDPARFALLALPVLPDPVPGFPGPLAGILAAMEWAAGLGAEAVLTVPGDAPFLPADLAARLREAGAPAIAASGGQVHPVVGLWPVDRRDELRRGIEEGLRRVRDFGAVQEAQVVEFPAPAHGPNPFLNLNTPEDWEDARRWL